MALAIDPC